MYSKAVDEVLLYKSLQTTLQDVDTDGDIGGKHRFHSQSVPGSRRISLYDFTGPFLLWGLIKMGLYFVDVLTQAAKKAPAPIIKLRRNSSIRDSTDVEERGRSDEQTPLPRRTQSMGNFLRQNEDVDLENEKEKNQIGKKNSLGFLIN